MVDIEILDQVLCTKSHEYVLINGDTAQVGITDYAVEQLGDIVFVELPDVGTFIEKGDIFGSIESVKAASELYMPISGKVVEINEKLTTEPELINQDSFAEGWLLKIQEFNKDDLDDALSYEEYKELTTVQD